MRDRKVRNDPMLLGEPSPSLAALEKMNMAKLAERAQRLTEEARLLGEKLERLKKVKPLPEEKIGLLTQSVARLVILQKAAADKLTEKVERKKRWDERNPNGAPQRGGPPRQALSGPRPSYSGPRPGGPLGPRAGMQGQPAPRPSPNNPRQGPPGPSGPTRPNL
ncbi:MAG: hypothetical protein K8S99_08125 [Planctomycetes bacterium]|nr:hypothetical protein [Planctomycetota bacterium]